MTLKRKAVKAPNDLLDSFAIAREYGITPVAQRQRAHRGQFPAPAAKGVTRGTPGLWRRSDVARALRECPYVARTGA